MKSRVETEKLYDEIPPTRRRNRREVFRKPSNQLFWTWLADRILFRMLSHRFYALRVKDKANFDARNTNYPVIAYANHSNWWDGIVGYNLMRRCLHLKVRMMIEELNRFPLFSTIGAFPINKKSPQEAIKSLKFIAEDLNERDMCFWIFPQGIIKPPNFRPFEFQTGLAYVAQKVAQKFGGVNLLPVSVNYTFLREDRPEVLVQFGKTICIEKDNTSFDRHEFTRKLEQDFTLLSDKQFSDFCNGEIQGYEYIFRQNLPWNRKLEKKLKHIGIED